MVAKKKQNHYIYPDEGDQVTVKMIDSSGGGDFWARDEELALQYAWRAIEDRFAGKRIRSLDFGTGSGRLVDALLRFGTVTAYDPDLSRFVMPESQGLEVVSQLPSSDEKYDVILISHVLQHISTYAVSETLAQLKNRLSEGGLLIILTTRTNDKDSIFAIETISSSDEHHSQPVDLHFFDQRVAELTGGNELPVRFFAESELSQILSDVGFNSEFSWRFHYSSLGLPASTARDILMIATPLPK